MMVARTDKEARLKDFIGEALASPGEDPARDIYLTLFVRNPDSPVARSLYAAWTEGLAEKARIRILICDTNSEEPATASLLDIAGAEFRVLADPSFGPAHEQLVVGRSHVWIGDCLRRDPTKRDAFELYHPNNLKNGVFASASVVQWRKHCRPLKLAKSESVSPEIIAAQSDQDVLPRSPRH